MTEPAKDSAAACAEALLIHYSFERGISTAEGLIGEWLKDYPATWLRLAVVEALYQGRYKAISVAHILTSWKRRGQPIYHFNHEFERLVCSKFPQSLTAEVDPEAAKRSRQKSDRSAALKRRQKRDLLEAQAIARNAEGGDLSPARQPAANPSAALITTPVPPSNEELAAPTAPVTTNQTPVSLPDTHKQFVPYMLPDPWLNESEDEPRISSSPAPESGGIREAKSSSDPKKTPERSPGKLRLDEIQKPEAYQPDWSRYDTNKSPIHQFTPKLQSPEFYSKLRAVAQPNPDSQTDPATDTPLDKNKDG